MLTKKEQKNETVAWYRRKETGIPRAIAETIRQALLDSRRLFASLDTERSSSEAFLFYLLVTLISNAVGLFFDMFFQSQMVWLAYFFVVLFLLPVLVAAGFYILAALLYVFVLVFQGKPRFKEPFVIVAYAGAANVFYVLPVWGPLLAAVATGVLYTVGLIRFFQLKMWKAVLITVLLFALLFTMLAISINGILQFTENRMRVNEALAESTVKTIATSVEKFAQDHSGVFPKDELELRYAKPAYLDRVYNGESIQGYTFALNLSATGYEILSAPVECGVTGFKAYRVKTGGLLEKGNCTSVKSKQAI